MAKAPWPQVRTRQGIDRSREPSERRRLVVVWQSRFGAPEQSNAATFDRRFTRAPAPTPNIWLERRAAVGNRQSSPRPRIARPHQTGREEVVDTVETSRPLKQQRTRCEVLPALPVGCIKPGARGVLATANGFLHLFSEVVQVLEVEECTPIHGKAIRPAHAMDATAKARSPTPFEQGDLVHRRL